MLFALNMILSGEYAVINKLKAIFKSNTVPLLTAAPVWELLTLDCAALFICMTCWWEKCWKLPSLVPWETLFWGKIDLFCEVDGVSPSSMSAGGIMDTFACFCPSPHCLWIFSIKAEQAGGCAGASPWAAEDGGKENSIRLSREKKRTYLKGEVNFLATLLLLFLRVSLCCSSSHAASGISGFVSWNGLISRLCSECQAGQVPGSSGLLHS